MFPHFCSVFGQGRRNHADGSASGVNVGRVLDFAGLPDARPGAASLGSIALRLMRAVVQIGVFPRPHFALLDKRFHQGEHLKLKWPIMNGVLRDQERRPGGTFSHHGNTRPAMFGNDFLEARQVALVGLSHTFEIPSPPWGLVQSFHFEKLVAQGGRLDSTQMLVAHLRVGRPVPVVTNGWACMLRRFGNGKSSAHQDGEQHPLPKKGDHEKAP